jgi:hypothetical protein
MHLKKVELPVNVGWLGRVYRNHLIRINKHSAMASWYRVKNVFKDENGLFYIQVKGFGPDYVKFNPMSVLEKLSNGGFCERFVLVENCPYQMNIEKKESFSYVKQRPTS